LLGIAAKSIYTSLRKGTGGEINTAALKSILKPLRDHRVYTYKPIEYKKSDSNGAKKCHTISI
jgi:hypothetical protein